jgi:hypothetical protein
MKYLIFFSSIVLFNQSCENFPEKFEGILFVNNSSTNVSFYYGFGELQGSAFPDTMLPLDKKLLQQNKIEILFKSLPRDTLSVFILATDTINTYSWDKVRSENKYLKRYDLSFRDLQNLDNTIKYK